MAQNKETDYFLKLDGIDGESQDSQHPQHLRIEEFRMNVVNRGQRGQYRVGKPFHDDVICVAHIDQAYPKIKNACANNEKVPKAVLTCRKAGKTQLDYLRITLSDVLVTKCKLDTDGGALPLVEITLSFVKLQIEYKEQKQEGGLGGAIMTMVDLRGRSGA